jgi:hypothetical protein
MDQLAPENNQEEIYTFAKEILLIEDPKSVLFTK